MFMLETNYGYVTWCDGILAGTCIMLSIIETCFGIFHKINKTDTFDEYETYGRICFVHTKQASF